MKAFWAAWEAAQTTNAALGVGAGNGARDGGAADSDAATEQTQAVGGAGGEEEEGEEVSSKASKAVDSLADSLGGVAVKEEAKAEAA
jgi:hypothetical protein